MAQCRPFHLALFSRRPSAPTHRQPAPVHRSVCPLTLPPPPPPLFVSGGASALLSIKIPLPSSLYPRCTFSPPLLYAPHFIQRAAGEGAAFCGRFAHRARLHSPSSPLRAPACACSNRSTKKPLQSSAACPSTVRLALNHTLAPTPSPHNWHAVRPEQARHAQGSFRGCSVAVLHPRRDQGSPPQLRHLLVHSHFSLPFSFISFAAAAVP
jgi:hypothetical protein